MKGGGSGTLFVVATPIGNLEDITLRALRVLREVALVAAEDTRRTGNLLRHYEIRTPLISLHAHNEQQRSTLIRNRLENGESVALVSDAGTPGISDPGATIVRAMREAGIRVEPIPGPSAVTAALSASGLNADRFVFAGFPPNRLKDRNKWYAWINGHSEVPVVCFEAPHKLRRTLGELGKLVNRPIIMAKELTKLHERWIQGLPEALEIDAPPLKGEFILIITPRVEGLSVGVDVSDEEIVRIFGQIANYGRGSRRDALRQVASTLGISTRQVFDALERSRNSAK